MDLGDILMYKLFFEDNRPININTNEGVIKGQREIIKQQQELIKQLQKNSTRLRQQMKNMKPDIARFTH